MSGGAISSVELLPADRCRWDLVAVGEIMLRLDPGDTRIARTRSFRVWEGGGEYNVARALKRCFGLRTAVVTALVDNAVGHLIDDLVYQGGVERAALNWVVDDGVGRRVRNGLNFTERGFGVRAAVGVSDRGHSAASHMAPGDIDWGRIFAEGVRWFHTGGIFAALSDTTAEVAREAMVAARSAGTVVSYDLNYRPSLWRDRGGLELARNTNRTLVGLADVLFGNEEDIVEALGLPDSDRSSLTYEEPDVEAYDALLRSALEEFPRLELAAATLRRVRTATVNDWTGVCRARDTFVTGPAFDRLEIYDRVGGGDGFAAGLIYGLLTNRGIEDALALAVAHGALTMTTPGDSSMATLAEVERLLAGRSPRIVR